MYKFFKFSQHFRSRNGEEISPEDERIKMDLQHKTVTDKLEECTLTLTIPDCGLEDIGKYKIVATNKWGDDHCSVSDIKNNIRFV